MKTTLVSKENNEAKFAMEFTAEEFDAAVDAAYKKSRGEFRINGFRKGKAPRREPFFKAELSLVLSRTGTARQSRPRCP